jgi:hypothetical protein
MYAAKSLSSSQDPRHLRMVKTKFSDQGDQIERMFLLTIFLITKVAHILGLLFPKRKLCIILTKNGFIFWPIFLQTYLVETMTTRIHRQGLIHLPCKTVIK